MDKIIIKDLKIYAYHGVNESEKQKGQIFSIDATLNFNDLSKPCTSDNLTDTVNYSSVVKTITKIVNSKNFNLLEKLSQEISSALLEEYSLIDSLTICIKKPMAPMEAVFDYVAVEVTRCR